MRKHVAWYVRGLYDNSSLCRDVNHCATPADVEALLLRYLEMLENAPEKAPLPEEPAWSGDGVDAHGSCPAP
jgi:hypothetical protein